MQSSKYQKHYQYIILYQYFLEKDGKKGKILSVIFENENKKGFMYGFTQNYVKVKHPFDETLCNSILNVTILDFDEEGNMTCILMETKVYN